LDGRFKRVVLFYPDAQEITMVFLPKGPVFPRGKPSLFANPSSGTGALDKGNGKKKP
jgi:hypothetical protein